MKKFFITAVYNNEAALEVFEEHYGCIVVKDRLQSLLTLLYLLHMFCFFIKKQFECLGHVIKFLAELAYLIAAFDIKSYAEVPFSI